MWNFITDTVLPLAGTLLVGVLGWWIAHWIAAPIVAFERTRRETREALYFYRHLSGDWKEGKIDQAEDELRRMAARVEAASITSSRIVRRYFKFRGWDLAKAASALHGFSNVKGTSNDEKKLLRHDIEVALKFPASDSLGRIARIEQRIDRAEG